MTPGFTRGLVTSSYTFVFETVHSAKDKETIGGMIQRMHDAERELVELREQNDRMRDALQRRH